MPIGNFPEVLSKAMLVGTMLVGGLGVSFCRLIPIAVIFIRGPGPTQACNRRWGL